MREQQGWVGGSPTLSLRRLRRLTHTPSLRASRGQEPPLEGLGVGFGLGVGQPPPQAAAMLKKRRLRARKRARGDVFFSIFCFVWNASSFPNSSGEKYTTR